MLAPRYQRCLLGCALVLVGCKESPLRDAGSGELGARELGARELGARDSSPRDGSAARDGAPVDRRVTADLPPPDPARTYWVSAKGAAAWSACKGLAPLADAAACSLATANTNAQAGDLVLLRAGTYNTGIAPAKSGSSSARLTFRGHSTEKVIITGAASGLALGNRTHVTVDNVTVEGCTIAADLRTASYVWILNSTLRNSSDTGGWPVAVRMYNNAQYNKIVNCTIGRSGYQTSNDDIGGVMNVGNWENPTDTTGYNLFENNLLYHGGHHVIEVAAHHNVFRGNTIHNENWTSCPRAATGNLCGNRGIGLYREELNANWNVFENNRFAFSGAAIDDSTGASGLSVRSRNTIVRRNQFYYNDGPGLHLYVDTTKSYEASYTYVYHNVFFKNGVSPLSASVVRTTYGLLFENSAGNSAPIPIVGVVVKNNLFHADVGGSLFLYYTDASKQTIVGNYVHKIYGSNASGFFTPTLPAGNIVSSADPLFVNVTPTGVGSIGSFDFHLQAGSPAIDKGAFLTTVTAAGSGTTLAVADAAYFINGYGIVEGDLIQLEGQTQTARIVSVDYAQNRLTLSSTLTFKSGQGVALAYTGSAPDIGAHER